MHHDFIVAEVQFEGTRAVYASERGIHHVGVATFLLETKIVAGGALRGDRLVVEVYLGARFSYDVMWMVFYLFRRRSLFLRL